MDEWIVTEERGFLPRHEPLQQLPKEFAALENLLQNMPIIKRDGSPGYLASEGEIVKASRKVPFYNFIDPSKMPDELALALLRDYCFWASAYVLEPCHHHMLRVKDIQTNETEAETPEYGPARTDIPANIAVPLCRLAEHFGTSPWLEYAHGYALANYAKIDNREPFSLANLRLIRTFEGSPHEAGFVLVHVAMVAKTGQLVKATKSKYPPLDQLRLAYEAMQDIQTEMKKMWSASSPAAYGLFRTFIMGPKGQPSSMFPQGLNYEGVPGMHNCWFRGESGANDSIIPTMDNFLGLQFPDNPLTDILKDFRRYRPRRHAEFLAQIRPIQLQDLSREEEKFYWILCLDQVRMFRARHWNFVREYIIKRSRHPVATGGSPIASWLPNQLTAIMDKLIEACRETKILFSNQQLLVIEGILSATQKQVFLMRSCVPPPEISGID